jgi:excinuclease UvrABC nuclease subunit
VRVIFERLFSDRLTLPPPDRPLDRLALPAHGAVYALTDEHGRLIQTIGAHSLRRSVTHRLAPPVEGGGKRADLRAVAHTVWWQPTYSSFETSFVYLNIARQLLGPDYRKQLAFGPVWSARIEPGAAFPRWTPQTRPFGAGVIAAGPFDSRKRCARFIETLEDLFDLCRYHEVLERAPRGQRCAYYDMGKCPAPCDGTIDLDTYRAMLAESIRFATYSGTEYVTDARARMEAAARELDFERAQQLKAKLERAEQSRKMEGRLALSPNSLRCLIVCRGARQSLVRPFFFDRGRIEPVGDVRLDAVEKAVKTWANRTWSSDKGAETDDAYRTECLWLVCHFLAKGEQKSGVYLNADALRDPETVARRVAESFSRTRAKGESAAK